MAEEDRSLHLEIGGPGADDTITMREAIEAIGWLSAELASRADAWNGNAPEWFPEPPEWMELWARALEETSVEPRRDG